MHGLLLSMCSRPSAAAQWQHNDEETRRQPPCTPPLRPSHLAARFDWQGRAAGGRVHRPAARSAGPGAGGGGGGGRGGVRSVRSERRGRGAHGGCAAGRLLAGDTGHRGGALRGEGLTSLDSLLSLALCSSLSLCFSPFSGRPALRAASLFMRATSAGARSWAPPEQGSAALLASRMLPSSSCSAACPSAPAPGSFSAYPTLPMPTQPPALRPLLPTSPLGGLSWSPLKRPALLPPAPPRCSWGPIPPRWRRPKPGTATRCCCTAPERAPTSPPGRTWPPPRKWR